MNDLEDFFEQAQQEAEDRDENLRDFALHLLRNSSMRDDDEGLEEELTWGDISPMRWSEIFTRLRMNQLREIDLSNWSQTDITNFYQKNGLDN
jgi:hypothetical protein